MQLLHENGHFSRCRENTSIRQIKDAVGVKYNNYESSNNVNNKKKFEQFFNY